MENVDRPNLKQNRWNYRIFHDTERDDDKKKRQQKPKENDAPGKTNSSCQEAFG